MKKRFFSLLIIIANCLLLAGLTIEADPQITASIDRDLFKVGDTVTVSINVNANPGLHGLYFDLAYDSTILEFDGLTEGLFKHRTVAESELLYAAAEDHLVVSYSLTSAGSPETALTRETGELVSLRFRVANAGALNTQYSFRFRDYGVWDAAGNPLAGARWADSGLFLVSQGEEGIYILIRQPYNNQVFYTDTVGVSAIFPAGAANTITLSNRDSGHKIMGLSAATGSINNVEIPLIYGFNRINATLVNSGGNTLAVDTVTVLRSGEDQFVKILSPQDHSLVNTDRVEIRVSSSFNSVEVNNQQADPLGEKVGDNQVFRTELWLRQGFNQVKAVARSAAGAIYTDTITVYYQKNDGIFRFVYPLEGDIYKPGNAAQLSIKGEIGALYNERNELNRVSLSVIYYPDNPALSSYPLVNGAEAKITETTLVSGDSMSPYMFYNDFPINTGILDSGKLELIAYKNKEGTTWDDEIHRFVYIDNNRLWINLVQPNIYGRDILNSRKKLTGFNAGIEPDLSRFRLQEDGSFVLKETEAVVKAARVGGSSGNMMIADLIETRDKALYALANGSDTITIYRKNFGAESWETVLTRSDMFGYTLCETDSGILVGVTNLYSNVNSGLYLLREQSLTNIVIGEPLNHVQFIKNHNGLVYLYGNNYSHLYAFNINTMEEDGARLRAPLAKKVLFNNNRALKEFELSSDAKVAALRTSLDEVLFYRNLDGTGFKPWEMDSRSLVPGTRYKRIVKGEYANGDYNGWLLIPENEAPWTLIMDHKKSHRFIVETPENSPTSAGETLVGVGFRDDNFIFVHKTAPALYRVRTGQALFKRIYFKETVTDYKLSAGEIFPGNYRLLAADSGLLYLGLGTDLAADARQLYLFTREYLPYAELAFQYINPDVEGLSALSFEVDSVWTRSDKLEFGFSVTGAGAVDPQLGQERLALNALLNANPDDKLFTIHRSYDSYIRKELIYIEFKNLLKNKELTFAIGMHAKEGITPALSNLTVYKKIPVKLPKTGADLIYLPLHGYVEDTTVQEIFIQEMKVPLERDGSFSCNYPIASTAEKYPMELYCTNALGDTTRLTFIVEIFESLNDIWQISLNPLSAELPPDAKQYEYYTESEFLEVTGCYYGLLGAVCGYELYDYVSEGGAEKPVLVRQGVFETEPVFDPAAFPLPDGAPQIGAGYEAGIFTGEKVKLVPGKQQLLLYVENPGGKRKEYTIAEHLPDVYYRLKTEDQEITIANQNCRFLEAAEIFRYNGVTFDKELALDVFEVAAEGTPAYVYKKNYIIRGEIKSLYKFYDLIIKSYDPEVTFTNGRQEITVAVDQINRFQAGITVTMPEKAETGDYHLSFTPAIPFLNWMETGVRIRATKDFTGTQVVPDFSPMRTWSDEEIRLLAKPLRIRFDRYLPAGARMRLLVNYQETIFGELKEVDPVAGIYKLMAGPVELDLTGVKLKSNRVQWWINYDKGLISSSSSGKPGMGDYLFNLEGELTHVPTVIEFNPSLGVYYNAGTVPVPPFKLVKDESTAVGIFFNNKPVTFNFSKQSASEVFTITDWNAVPGLKLLEGRNTLLVTYKEKLASQTDKVEYRFLYDTQAPECIIDSYRYDAGYRYLVELTAIIKEVNLDKVNLYYTYDPDVGESKIDSDMELLHIGEDLYKACWKNLDNQPLPLSPSGQRPLLIRLTDHAGNQGQSDNFSGIADLERPQEPDFGQVNLEPYDPAAQPYFAGDDGTDPYNGHMKFYNASVSLVNNSLHDTWLFERPYDIDLKNGISTMPGSNTTLRAGRRLGLHVGFSASAESNLHMQLLDKNLADSYLPQVKSFAHNRSSDNISFVFYFRSEHLPYYENFEGYRRILTFYDKERNGDRTSLFLGYKEGSNNLYVVNSTTIDEVTETDPPLLGGPGTEITFLEEGNWNSIAFSIQHLERKILLAVNDKMPVYMSHWDVIYDTIFKDSLKENALYYFGDKDPEAMGHFSIARAFYINEVVDMAGAEEILGFTGSGASPDIAPHRLYTFDSLGADTGSQYFQLRTEGDYFCAQENADYSEAGGTGALKASSEHVNVLHSTPAGICFRDADNPILINLTMDNTAAGGTAFTVRPVNSLYAGKYYFGDLFGNHGLKLDKWYSVTGTVFPLTENGVKVPVDARLVLRINDREQSWELKEGGFHFIYEHNAGTALEDVVLYLETRKGLMLSKNIICSAGNYSLPPEGADRIGASYASTKYLFYPKGTVEFRYKPFHVNKAGFVSYDALLFNSDFIRIGTKLEKQPGTAGEGYAKFYAQLVGTDDEEKAVSRTLDTQVFVKEGWQHIQFSFSRDEKVAYFYIDGKLAAALEGPEGEGLPIPRGITGGSDNVFFGYDRDSGKYAEGYLDEIAFSHLYKASLYNNAGPFYSARNPVEFTYTDTPVSSLDIQLTDTSREVTDIVYILESRNGVYWEKQMPTVIGNHGFDIAGLEAGPYILRAWMLINGHRYHKTFSFIKNNRPCFSIRSLTPLVLRGVKTDIVFKLNYDASYLVKTIDSVFAGVAVQIKGTRLSGLGEEEPFNRILYLTQDFVSQKPYNTTWLSNTGEGAEAGAEWQVVNLTGETIDIVFKDMSVLSAVEWELRSFYIDEKFTPGRDSFENLQPEKSGVIPDAEFTARIESIEYEVAKDSLLAESEQSRSYEYKIKVEVGTGEGSSTLLNFLSIGYQLKSLDPGVADPPGGVVELKGMHTIDLFYDDILKEPGYGRYECTLSLRYLGELYGNKRTLTLNWEQVAHIENPGEEEKRLLIMDWALLYLDKGADTAQLYLEYDQNNIDTINYELYVLSLDTGETTSRQEGYLNPNEHYRVFNNVPVPEGRFYVQVLVYSTEDGLMQKAELNLVNSLTAPDVYLTNSVPSLIAYNNVMFSWRGYHEGVAKTDIRYAYDFDGRGWSAFNSEWRQIDLFNLAEGFHLFQVKAEYYGEESSEERVTFFIDIQRPRFVQDKIHVEKFFDADGIPYAVFIRGDEGAITDASLSAITVNGQSLVLGKNGSFNTDSLPLLYDGENSFVLSAYDKVGNFTDYTVVVDNPLTTILYPQQGRDVRFSPMTVVGKINPAINADMEVYLFDPLSSDRGETDLSGWKKAKINEDRVFFIDDVYINPGSITREAYTPLELKVKVRSGRIYRKKIAAWAKEILMPIEMELSTHAVQGEKADTNVTITCTANVEDISSWSIDYTGDGIYDSVEMVDNPLFGKSHTWKHVYSSLGCVTPRVRVITGSGQYFSVTSSIIIHEQIKEASHVLVPDPVAMSAVRRPDNSDRIFILAGAEGRYRIEVYEVGRNETYISNRLFTIKLDGFGIDNPVGMKALDEEHLFIAFNRNGRGTVFALAANQYGNYLPVSGAETAVNEAVVSMDADADRLFLTLQDTGRIATVSLQDKLPVPATLEYKEPEVRYAEPVGKGAGICRDLSGLLLADYFNQRLLKLSDSLQVLSYTGGFGNKEGEFVKPNLVQTAENRIFVYDAGRYDIQVFDPSFNVVTTIAYNALDGAANYLEPNFLNSVCGMGVLTREDKNRLFYYSLILSKTTGKLALLRLPQWEELRARVRNNKIVFLQDNEVMTAKPTGSDLARILSSDSIPRIQGTLDYPAFSPDGRKIIFTSREELYDRDGASGSVRTNKYSYDTLYMIDVQTKDLTRIPLGELGGYEVERPVYSYNGDKIVFSAKPTGSNWQIYIYDVLTGGIRRLFTTDENVRFPYFSTDDRFIVFTTDYDGDEEIEIVDTVNTNVRVSVTSNNARDSFPVWSPVYPFEIANPDLDIESKIAFVSERNFHKGLYYVYLRRASEADIRVVTKSGEETGADPDQAAVEITSASVSGDYPCFTGDGMSVVYEHFDGYDQVLNRYDFETGNRTQVNLPAGARRPAGMKNTIAHFTAVPVNGDEVVLAWNGYTDKSTFYTVRFKQNQPGQPFVQKKVFTHSGTTLKGLEMGMEYLFKVSIVENGIEEAATLWKKVVIPEVAALPTCEVDAGNPYLVRLHAWKPDPELEWNFNWIIDNQEISIAQGSQDFLYEFATSGRKTIVLKAANKANTYTSISAPVQVDIKTDIIPRIEYLLTDSDRTYIELSCDKSPGSKIDFASAAWIISGPGSMPLGPVTGSRVIIPLDSFAHKINVNLKLRRKAINGQAETDILEKNLVVDLDLKEVKPVIIYAADTVNPRLINFSGNNSLGNIDWYRARWMIFGDGIELHREEGVSSLVYRFPESGQEVVYTVSLTIPRRNDGQTVTTTVLVSVEPAPIEPVIDYEVLELKEDGKVVGAKLLLSCAGSRGSNIDFSQARWSVPVAGSYNEQPTQVGPTAIYNLFQADEKALVEVSLTLMRRGGTEVKSVTELISLKKGELASVKVLVNRSLEESATGSVLVLDVLGTTGPNIEWEKTEWLINDEHDQYQKKGAAVRIDLSASGEAQLVRYTCYVYTLGNPAPIVVRGEESKKAAALQPLIASNRLPGEANNLFELNVTQTPGVNIDWERTTWYIYDGNENVVQKYGARIVHAFAFKQEAMGYPVMVEMFFKKSTLPFVGYAALDVEGDELLPVIAWDMPADRGDENVVHFSARESKGSNIDWSQTRWSFGDNSEMQYGPVVVHKYPVDTDKREYKVSVTLVRKAANGASETQTAYKTITIGSDNVQPVIKAKMRTDGYLILSAEESEGRGLLLDRSLWVFEGKGDSASLSVNEKVGKVSSDSHSDSSNTSWNLNASGTAGVNNPGNSGVVATITIGGGYSDSKGSSDSYNTTSYEGFKDQTESFSSQNVHTGAVCRRYVKEYDMSKGKWDRDTKRTLMVTLFVYRMSAEGGMTGRSVTVNIDLDEARQAGGVRYE